MVSEVKLRKEIMRPEKGPKLSICFQYFPQKDHKRYFCVLFNECIKTVMLLKLDVFRVSVLISTALFYILSISFLYPLYIHCIGGVSVLFGVGQCKM